MPHAARTSGTFDTEGRADFSRRMHHVLSEYNKIEVEMNNVNGN